MMVIPGKSANAFAALDTISVQHCCIISRAVTRIQDGSKKAMLLGAYSPYT